VFKVHIMKTYGGNESKPLRILNLCTRWRCVGKSVSHSNRSAVGTYWIWGLASPKPSLDAVTTKEIPACHKSKPSRQINSLYRLKTLSQVRSSGLYRVNVQWLRIFVRQSRTIIVTHSSLKTSVFISYYSRCSNWWPCCSFLSFFLSCFFRPMHYSVPSFLNITVFHYNVFTMAVPIQSNQQLALVG
jgi:hypothetical protein